MRRLAALLTVTALLLLALPVLATGDYPTTTPNDPCDEYHESRHPECQTTTTYQTTTTVEQSTTTTQPTTTTTPNETTTTGQVQETTTTTAAPCAPGLIHQPPLCVDPSTTIPVFDTTTTVVPLEVLPFTGASTGPLALSALALAVLGGAMIRKGRTA